MITLQGLNIVLRNWNIQLLAACIGLLFVPLGLLASFFEIYVKIVIPMKATLNVYMPADIPTLIIESTILGFAGTLCITLYKISQIACRETIEQTKEMLELLDMKMEANDISARFIDRTLILAEETCKSYNKLLYIVDMNKTKEVDIYDLTRAAVVRRNTAEQLKYELQKSLEQIEKSTPNFVFLEDGALEL